LNATLFLYIAWVSSRFFSCLFWKIDLYYLFVSVAIFWDLCLHRKDENKPPLCGSIIGERSSQFETYRILVYGNIILLPKHVSLSNLIRWVSSRFFSVDIFMIKSLYYIFLYWAIAMMKSAGCLEVLQLLSLFSTSCGSVTVQH